MTRRLALLVVFLVSACKLTTPPPLRLTPPPPSVTPPPRENRLPLVPPRESPARSTARPSKDDLAAVDALFNSRPVEGPLAAFEKTDIADEGWTPGLRRASTV